MYSVCRGWAWTLRATDTVFFPDNCYRVGLTLPCNYAGHVVKANFDGCEIAECVFPLSTPLVSSAPTAYDPVEEIKTLRAGSYKVPANDAEILKGPGTNLWGCNDSYFHSHQRPMTSMWRTARPGPDDLFSCCCGKSDCGGGNGGKCGARKPWPMQNSCFKKEMGLVVT